MPRPLPFVLFALLASSAVGAAPAARPNILFILADDLGARDLGCYGSTFHETPHLDRLAGEGLRFTQAYTAASICSPTRASLMTGKYPVRTGITDYIPGLPSTGRKLSTRPTRTELALEETTIGEAFQAGGYQTFYAGKWHLGNKGYEPSEQGFERYVSSTTLGDYGRDWRVGQRLAESAVEFLRTRDRQRPFLAWLSFHEPHTPILEYPDHIARFQRKAAALPATSATTAREHEGEVRLRQDDAAYGSEVAGLDGFVGTVLAALEAQGLRDNTIVVFFSDNGGLAVKASAGPTSNAPLRAGKGWLYEGGIRVPLLVRAPGVTRAGGVVDVPVISTDFYPTLLALAGLPLRPEQHLDGVNLAPLLRGEAGMPARPLFWHYPHYHGSTWAPGAAMRDGHWKLVELQHYEAVELYDLVADPAETRDLARQQPEVTARLLGQLHAWQRATGAFIPTPNSAATESAPPAKKKRRNQKEN